MGSKKSRGHKFIASNTNCCKNCVNAKDYSGLNDHFCKVYQHMIRAERYDCEHFRGG